jgi:hypothetical protein
VSGKRRPNVDVDARVQTERQKLDAIEEEDSLERTIRDQVEPIVSWA